MDIGFAGEMLLWQRLLQSCGQSAGTPVCCTTNGRGHRKALGEYFHGTYCPVALLPICQTQ